MKPMLAATCEDMAKLRFPLLATPKIDGIRALNIEGNLLARSLKAIPNKYVRSVIGIPELHGLDGELDLQRKATFQEVSSAILSEDGEPAFIYRVFDLVIPNVAYSRRMALLDIMSQRIADLGLTKHFAFLFPQEVKTLGELQLYTQTCLDQGWEGAMVRKPEGSYKFGRSTFNEHGLIKIKPFEDDEATIVGFEELQHNANEAETNALGHTERSSAQAGLFGGDTLGALVCESPKWPNVTFKIGTGFDALTRRNIWMSQKDCLGRKVKYKFQRIGSLDRPRVTCP